MHPYTSTSTWYADACHYVCFILKTYPLAKDDYTTNIVYSDSIMARTVVAPPAIPRVPEFCRAGSVAEVG